jgi:hypothetical protein
MVIGPLAKNREPARKDEVLGPGIKFEIINRNLDISTV